MAVSKVILNGTTLIDVTQKTVTSASMLNGVTALKNDGTDIVGSYDAPTFATQSKTVSPSTSQQTVSPDSGYDGLSQVTVNAMPSGTAGTPTATKGTVTNHSVSVTPSVTNTSGYITGGTKSGTAVTVSASELVSGTKSITENGTGIDVTNYASVDVGVSGGGVSTASVTILTSGYYELILPPSASQSGNTVTLPTDAIFVIIFYDMLYMASTTGTVTRSIYGDATAFVSVCPGQDGGTITLVGGM